MASNRSKIRVLRAPDRRGCLDAPLISALTGFRLVRAVYGYTNRHRRWGLVEPRKPLGGMILYRISLRGRERPIWLQRTSELCPLF